LVRKANSELPLTKDGDPLKEVWKSKGKVGIDEICALALRELFKSSSNMLANIQLNNDRQEDAEGLTTV
jgi:hypothetical protein